MARSAEEQSTKLRWFDEGALWIGEQRIATDDVKLGWVDVTDRLVFELHDGDRWTLAGLDESARQQVLERMECSASQRALDTSIAAPYLTSFGCRRLLTAAAIPFMGLYLLVSPCALVAALGSSLRLMLGGELAKALAVMGPTAAAMGLVMGLSFLMYRYYRPSGLRVGTDGVRVERWLSREFVPYAKVTDVRHDAGPVRLRVGNDIHMGVALRNEHGVHVLTMADGSECRFTNAAVVALDPGAVVLVLRDGSEVRLPGADVAVAQRIREAMATREERRAAGLRIERLDRGERDVATWKKQLNDVAKPGDYRGGGGIGEKGLLDVVEDPGASPEQRVAAAYALSRIETAPKHRIRVAAQACADDAMREALEEAAEGELALAQLEAAASRAG